MADIEARLRSLLKVNAAVVGHLHVRSVLARLASSAIELADADYAAVRLAGRDVAFVEAGRRTTDSDVVEVPVEVTGEPFGTLVVAGHPSGTFSDDDVEFLQALAVTAGIAVDKARRYEATRQRERWAQATADVRAAAARIDGTDAADGDVIDALLTALPALTGSTLAADATINDDGSATLRRPGRASVVAVPASHPLAVTLRGGRRAALESVELFYDGATHPLGATLVLPAPSASSDADGVIRALVVARPPGAGPLPPGDIARLDSLADETSRAVAQALSNGSAPGEPIDDDLSPREREVLLLIADGLSNRQIAQALFLSEKTVKNYITTLLRKLGMQRRTQAAVYGAQVRDLL